MPLRATCPRCSKRFQAPESAAGKRGKCPGCGQLITLTDSSSGNGSDQLDATFSVDRPFDAADFDTIRPPAPEAVPETRFRDLYAPPLINPPTKTNHAAQPRADSAWESPANHGRHGTARRFMVFCDWLLFWFTWLFSFLTVIAVMALELGGNGKLVLINHFYIIGGGLLLIVFLWVAYLWEHVAHSVVLAIFDMEDHLNSMRR